MATALGSSVLVLGCGLSPDARTPSGARDSRVPYGAIRVVPADQVKGTCRCDDDDDDADVAVNDDDVRARRRGVEYVKLSEWRPPRSVEELEASIPPRGSEPPSYTTFPRLTLHRPIENTGYRRAHRAGNVHAR